jgi:hypothetical protein
MQSRGSLMQDNYLYDGSTQDVSTEPQSSRCRGGGSRAGDESQHHAQRGQASPACDDPLLQHDELACSSPG